MKSSMFKAIQLECSWNSWIWSLSAINSTMLLTSSKDSRTKSTLSFWWTILTPLDTSQKWGISRFWKVMITLDSTEMCLLTPLLALISWDSLKRKWRKKEETQGQWTKFRVYSRNLNLSISEPPLKNCGWKISTSSVKFTWTLPQQTWWRTWSSLKPISKLSK